VDQILVGYVRRAHGLNGAVVVRPLTDDPANRWVPGAVLLSDHEPPKPYTITAAAPYRDDLLVQFAEVTDRSSSELLQGISFTIEADERRDLDDDEFWPDDLVGCVAVDEAGATIGVIDAVEFGSAQDRLVVQTGAGRFEVPFVDAIVPTIDLEARVVVLTPPAGLFESL
jgi:16S rRNA processing protein RimM